MQSNRYSVMQRVILATVLVAGVSGVASAGDSSISRFGGDSYAYFNSQPIDKSASTWRQANPEGLSERLLQAYSGSSAGSAWQLNPPVPISVASDATFKQTHPNGLSERELQALSSEGAAWHASRSGATGVASNGRVARLFDSSK